MGMYTEIFFRAELRTDVPTKVIDLIRAWITNEVPDNLPDHPLFKCDRWGTLLNGGSAYFPTMVSPVFARGGFSHEWELSFNSSLKNYDGEIQQFFDWINPYLRAVPGEFIGYHLYEADEVPTLMLKKESN